MAQLTLYNYFRSSTSYRARIALNIKGLSYEYKAVRLLNNGGEQNQPEYRKLNPSGGVPTLVHTHSTNDQKIISQSTAIIDYLDDMFPTPPLYPQDTYLKAKVKQICSIVACDMHALQNLRTLQYLEKNLNVSEVQKKEWAQHWIKLGLSALEKQLEPFAKTYSFGDQITAADLYIIPQLFTANRFEVDINQWPLLKKINENCLKLDAFDKAHPSKQPDTPK